ncbi:MAG: B12-binding domain-containing radical SAM protein [Planctomycetes bacterium]|nr:B12-binding domain-containing radical SAM protein [Planctomycetota bacterium]
MRVALIAPPWEVMPNSYPPLGLGYLASVAQRSGHEVRIFDFGLTPQVSTAQAVESVSPFNPQVVGISAWTHTFHRSLELARALKSAHGATTIFGGPHPTVFPTETLANDGVDHVAMGEAEETFVEFLARLEAKATMDGVLGLCYKDGSSLRQNAPRPFIRDLDALPLPDRDLLNVAAYPLRAANGAPMTTVLTSRGCPYACVYCYKGLFGTRYRERSAESVISEIEGLMTKYGFRDFYFVDDLFVFNMERLRRILALIREKRLSIRWQCLARVDRMPREAYAEMADAGCDEIHFGIESGSPEILKTIGKHITIAQVENAVRWAKEAGIKTKGYFMTGLPGDTMRTMKQTLDFACRLHLDDAMFSLTTPLPGTRLWELVKDKLPSLSQHDTFAKAFYFAGGDQIREPLFNLSNVDGKKLVQFTQNAPNVFWKRTARRREFKARFGAVMGDAIWRLSLVTLWRPVAWLKRALFQRHDAQLSHA